MGEVATIQVDKVFPGRKAGQSEVFDVRTADGKKFAAWGSIGETMHGIGSGSVTVEYELRPKNGYDNATILKVLTGTSNGGSTAQQAHETGANKFIGNLAKGITEESRSKQINRSVAFKGAIDLWTAGGNVTGTLEDIVAVAELTQGLLDVVEGTYSVSDGFSLEDTQ